jgi:hypothetical protein
MSNERELFHGDTVLIGEHTEYQDMNECDVEIFCECGNQFWVYITLEYWRCSVCGLIYMVSTKVEKYQEGRG